MKVTILGCGASAGVPVIACDCEVCSSENPKNKRSRASILVEENGANILIDASTDFRMQALTHKIAKVDGVLFTHEHADHVHGIDDLRIYNCQSSDNIDIYGLQDTIDNIKSRFSYAFDDLGHVYKYKPAFKANVIEEFKAFNIDSVEISAFPQDHTNVITAGYRIGDFAYSTDLKRLSQESLDFLKGIKVWVVDCQDYVEIPTHSHLEQTLKWIEEVNPDRAILTHMSHKIDYDEILSMLPKNIVPGFDGMVIDKII